MPASSHVQPQFENIFLRWLAFVWTKMAAETFESSDLWCVNYAWADRRTKDERCTLHMERKQCDVGFLVLYVINMLPKILREIKSESCAGRLHHFSTVIVFI